LLEGLAVHKRAHLHPEMAKHPSDPIVVTIPVMVASEPQAKPAQPLVELAAIAPNVNGNGNYAGSSRLS
jgi:hypothetical protein